MAAQHLTVLHSPDFPQVLDAALRRLFDRMLPEFPPQLSPCSYESPESAWGACDGGIPCSQIATVHHLASDMQFCMGHFGEVGRG